MKIWHSAFTLIIILAGGPYLCAQKNLIPASQSTLTGIAMPEGTKLDKRLLVRAAAKSLMDMEAKDQGAELGSRYEVLMMPAGTGDELSAFIIADAEKKGWKIELSKSDTRWGWLARDGKEMMIHFEGDKKESWLYLSEVNRRNIKTDSLRVTDIAVKPSLPAANPLPPVASTTEKPVNSVASKGYQFHTTTFDDGWTASAKENWIELVKGNIVVLVHFPHAGINMGEGQTPVLNASAWDVLVAPRYVAKSGYYAFNGNMSYMRSSATTALLTDKQGKTSYVVLFRRGGGPFMEFICPDKAAFVAAFGMDISPENQANLLWSDDALWAKMDNMQSRNKFAVAAQDLPGYWTSSSSTNLQMYYVNTGGYAGMNATSIAAEFWIEPNGAYRSQHKGATGMVGSQQVYQQEYKGNFTMNGNWEISFTNRYNGKTDTFLCAFEVVKGGRILHLTNKTANGDKYQLGRQK